MEKRNIREAVFWQVKRNKKGRKAQVEIENAET
jgi:hypothetical protein